MYVVHERDACRINYGRFGRRRRVTFWTRKLTPTKRSKCPFVALGGEGGREYLQNTYTTVNDEDLKPVVTHISHIIIRKARLKTIEKVIVYNFCICVTGRTHASDLPWREPTETCFTGRVGFSENSPNSAIPTGPKRVYRKSTVPQTKRVVEAYRLGTINLVEKNGSIWVLFYC